MILVFRMLKTSMRQIMMMKRIRRTLWQSKTVQMGKKCQKSIWKMRLTSSRVLMIGMVCSFSFCLEAESDLKLLITMKITLIRKLVTACN